MDLVDFSRLPDVSQEHPELDENERWYAAQMKAREDALESIFGQTEPPGQILSPGDPQLMINWPGGGIHRYPPRPGRTGWHFVTHGLAQPHDPDETGDPHERVSGFGIELVISTPDESDWAPHVLLSFVRYLLMHEEAQVFLPGHRIPTGVLSQIDPDTKLTGFLAVSSPEYDHELLLPAGRCSLVHLVPTTTAEIERARADPGDGSGILARVLGRLGPGTLTETGRPCVTEHEDFDEVWVEESGN